MPAVGEVVSKRLRHVLVGEKQASAPYQPAPITWHLTSVADVSPQTRLRPWHRSGWAEDTRAVLEPGSGSGLSS